ncbi:MAG TPA: hypothetical protein PKM25_00515 [Candidatus Ozemobacteraceae bacterium]|nr:hypothetical protein [Candidatus Ozemobacteraceae bacterium]
MKNGNSGTAGASALVRNICGVLALLFWCALCEGAAVNVDYRWHETDLVLKQDGRATVTSKIRVAVKSGSMGGFDYQGFAGDPQPRADRCVVVYKDTSSQPLKVVRSNENTLAVDIDGTRRISQGEEATFILVYDVDLVADGFIGRTTRQEGAGSATEMIFLDWADTVWNERMEHRTIRVTLPKKLAEALPNTESWRKAILTEPFMNATYRIDYRRKRDESGRTFWLEQLLHRENVPAMAEMRVKEYFPLTAFPEFTIAPPQPVSTPVQQGEAPLEQDSDSYAAAEPDETTVTRPDPPPTTQAAALAGLFALLFVFAGLMLALVQKRYLRLRGETDLSNLSWSGETWEAPRVQVSTFRKNGKVATLTVPEAMLLLGYPANKLVACIVASLEAGGQLKILTCKPLCVKISESASSEDPYEKLFLASVRRDGTVEEEAIRQLLTKLSDEVGSKMWDCDPDATAAHYRSAFEQAARQYSPKPDPQVERDPYPRYGRTYLRSWYFLNYPSSRTSWDDTPFDQRWDDVSNSLPVISDLPAIPRELPAEMPPGMDSLANSACHSACHDACHSACHDACHSACHDACHSACHSACHDACHSACVSGNAR